MVRDLQKKLEVDSMQLLYYQAPLSVVILLPMIFIFENVPKIIFQTIELHQFCKFLIFLTSIAGFGVNLSTYNIVDKSSPLTYNIASHGKTAMLFLGGILFFGDIFTYFQLLGLSIAAAGLVGYTKANLDKPKQAPAILPIDKAVR